MKDRKFKWVGPVLHWTSDKGKFSEYMKKYKKEKLLVQLKRTLKIFG